MSFRYKISANPVFFSPQGEAHLRGFQMTFIRLSGCSVGCANCDTDYSKSETKTAEELADWADKVTPREQRDRRAWITGGEPTDQDLKPLLKELLMAVCQAFMLILVHHQPSYSTGQLIDISHLHAGSYLLKVTGGQPGISKIIYIQ